MDSLVEVEGTPEAIESAISLIGLPELVSLPSDSLISSLTYEARTGRSRDPVLAVTVDKDPRTMPFFVLFVCSRRSRFPSSAQNESDR
jgi:hypothetical protein